MTHVLSRTVAVLLLASAASAWGWETVATPAADDAPVPPATEAEPLPKAVEESIERDKIRPIRLQLDERGKRIDLPILDMHHNIQIFTRPYRNFFREMRVLVLNGPDFMPVLSLYRPVSDACIIGLNSWPQQWTRVTDKFNHFLPDEDLTPIQEVAAAHEVGHCMAARYAEGQNRRWGVPQRELFADIFALMHMRQQLPDDHDARAEAFGQMLRFRIGGPKDPTRPSADQLAVLFTRIEDRWPWTFGTTAVGEQWAEMVMELMGLPTAPSDPAPAEQ